MSMTEAPFSLTVKIMGNLFTVRGDSWPEFESNLADAAANANQVTNGIQILLAAGELTMPQQHAQQPAQAAPIQQPAYQPQVQQSAPPPQWQQPPGLSGTVLFNGATQTVVDKWGKKWTYNMPGAPDLPDGRGRYAWLEAVSQAGKPYQCWADPAKGPEQFPSGSVEAPRIWPDRR